MNDEKTNKLADQIASELKAKGFFGTKALFLALAELRDTNSRIARIIEQQLPNSSTTEY